MFLTASVDHPLCVFQLHFSAVGATRIFNWLSKLYVADYARKTYVVSTILIRPHDVMVLKQTKHTNIPFPSP